jgi:hypothetical protein
VRSEYALGVGPEVGIEAERIAVTLSQKYSNLLFVAGQLAFDEDTLWNRLMHNETALGVHRRLHHHGFAMIVLPVRLNLDPSEQRRPSPAPEPSVVAAT